MIADRLYIPDETIVSPIILMGPTTTGKSSLAKLIAHGIGADIVNSDRLYSYAGPEFNLGLGLEPGELDDGVGRHLYGIRAPHEDPLDPDSYVEKAVDTIDEITRRGVPTVVDGCTRRYNEALYNHYGPDHCVRISWQSRGDLPERVNKRMQGIINMGLYNEAEEAIAAGHELTFPMTSILYTLARGVYHDPRSEQQRIEQAKTTWLDVALRHDDWYERNTNAVRFDRTADGNSQELADAITELMVARVAGT